jgi:integrating conjugative element protein (TIGR03758 family)
MNAAQATAFQTASSVTPAALLLAIAGIVLTLAIVWSAWVAYGSYRAWGNGELTLYDMILACLRAAVLLMVLGFYLR